MHLSGGHTGARGLSTSIPLTDRAPGDVLFRRPGGEPVTAARFLHDVAGMAERLPERPYALNLSTERYPFAVAFAAALVRGQVSLLSSDRSPHGLERLAAAYPDAYTIGGDDALPIELPRPPGCVAQGDPPASLPTPRLAADRTAAIVFTSGSTGEPLRHAKPMAALAACSSAAARQFDFGAAAPASIVGTVPPQHMYGFETTVLLPLHAPVSSFADGTFFPHDIVQALAAVPPPRVLVTTPLQLRVLLEAGLELPTLSLVISATAPLATEFAAAAERRWGVCVREIFGATEVGSIASRRTIEGDRWETYDTVRLRAEGDAGVAVQVRGLPGEVLLADRVALEGEGQFRLLGRPSDLLKLGGKRASLEGLNAALQAVPGVVDGVFFAPDDLGANPAARLIAFVVAPGRTADDIQAALRSRIDAPFLPRRVVMLPALPRNPVGKLQRSALLALQAAPAGGTNAT